MRIPLELAPGLVSDETTHSTPGRWADGNNVRFRDGRPEVIGGWAKYHATLLTGVCRSSLGWIDALGVVNIALGTHSNLHVIKDGSLADITPAGLDTGEIDTIEFDGGYGSGGYGMGGYGVGEIEAAARTWSLANWGESLMASPAGGGIYWWQNDPGTVAAIVSNAPTSVDRMTVAPTRQVAAMGCAEETSGVYNPMCIRISEIEDATDWTTAPDNNVSENILPGGGRIIDGRPYGDGLIVWTDNALFVGTFIGASDQAWRFDRIAVGCGLIGPQAAVVVNQTAYWMTADMQFFAYQFGGVPTVIPCPIRREISENIDSGQTAKIVAASIGEFQEVWWFYPDTRDGDENSRYVAVSTADGAWFRGDVARTAFMDSGPLLYPLGVSYAGQSYLHEYGDDADGAALTWHIESALQYLGEGERNLLVRGVWPDFEAQTGSVSLTLKHRAYPQGSDVAKGPHALAAGREKKDFMAQGRLFAIKLSGSEAGTFMRLGRPSFDAVPAGER